MGAWRVYAFKMWNNGTLVRDFVPVRQNSTGKYGMLDLVNGVFYGNANTSSGTTDFTPGPIVDNQNSSIPGMVGTVTWQANNANGIMAGTVSLEARCNSVQGSFGHAVTGSPSGFDTVGNYCWCKMTDITADGQPLKTPNSKWVFDRVREPSDQECSTICASDCVQGVQKFSAFRPGFFGQ